jgi:hypothetical protein
MMTNLLTASKFLKFQKKNAKPLSHSMTVQMEKTGKITPDGKQRMSLVIGTE